ncbi:reverse transcriptase domain-containing protein [Tanacetum coccineum]
MYHENHYKDVVDHIAKVLKMVDLIYALGVDSYQLRMKVFPLSLADDAKEWWISDGDEKITTWEELVEKFFCRFYPESYDGEDEMLDEGENWGIDPLEFLSNINTSFKYHKKVDGRTQKVIFHAWMNGNWNKRYVDNSISSSNELKESKYENPSNTATDSFFKAYEVRDIEKQSQTKRKYSNTSNSINELPNKRRCKAEKLKAIQYSLGSNEEYIAIRSYEYDIWERNEDNMSKIYQDIFQKKDEGWKITILKTNTPYPSKKTRRIRACTHQRPQKDKDQYADEVSNQHSYNFNVVDDPKTFNEVTKSQDFAFWKEVIKDEMDSIMGNNTWVLVDLPPGCKPLGYKWIFKRKLKVNETIENFKVRLVIQSFRQKSGIAYFDTYALVARISTIRLLIAMASIHKYDYSLDGCEDNILKW